MLPTKFILTQADVTLLRRSEVASSLTKKQTRKTVRLSQTIFTASLRRRRENFPSNLKIIPYYRKLTLHEIKVLEINANLTENDFRIKKINAKEEVEFHNKGN